MSEHTEIVGLLTEIRDLLAGGASASAPAPATDKPKTTTKPKAASGPTLEQVQDKVRELAAADDANKEKIKAAIVKLGGKRAGDFEGDPAKLGKLMTALEAMEGDEAAPGYDDDDLL